MNNENNNGNNNENSFPNTNQQNSNQTNTEELQTVNPATQTESTPMNNSAPNIADNQMNQQNMMQNQINNQPAVENQVNQQMTYAQNQNNNQPNYGMPNQPKKSKVFWIIVAILGTIILGLVGYIIFDNISSKKTEISNPNQPENINTNTNTNTNTNPTNTGTQTPSSSVFTVDGYEMNLPQGYELQEIEGATTLINKIDKIAVVISVVKNAAYENIVEQKDTLKTSLEKSSGLTISNYEEKTFGNISWLVYRISNAEIDSSMGFTKLSSYDSASTLVANYGNSKNESQIYGLLGEMINSSKNSTPSSFAKTNKKSSDVKVKVVKIDKNVFK